MSDIPPAYSDSAPPAKLVALDDGARIYLVGTDNQIYWEHGGNRQFGLFYSQPPISCISKLVVEGSGLTGQVLWIKGCDQTVYGFDKSNGWVQAGTGALDISSGGGTPGIFLDILMAGGNRPIYYYLAGGTNWASHPVAVKNNSNSAWSGGGGPAQAARIGGRVTFIGNYFAGCPDGGGLGDFIAPGYFLNTGDGSFVGAGNAFDGKFNAAPVPGGCSTLQFPGGSDAFDISSSPYVTKLTTSHGTGGPGDDLMWIMTNTTRIYALTRTMSTE